MNHYQEITRYLDNAREILSTKAKKEGQEYKDIKYVQMASGTAYNAALMIADGYLRKKEGGTFTKPQSIDEYRIRLQKYSKLLVAYLNEAHDRLHLVGYLHGTPSVGTIKRGLEVTDKMLARIA